MTSKEIQASQFEIRRKYGDELVKAINQMCVVCRFGITGRPTDEIAGCTIGLLPVCEDGSDCPYLIRSEDATD